MKKNSRNLNETCIYLILFLIPYLISCSIEGGDAPGGQSIVIDSSTVQFIDPEKAVTQIDRIGKPAVNLFLISTELKDTFNESNPVDDFRFRGIARANLEALGKGNTAPDTLVNNFLPDILVIDSNVPTDFSLLNGRKLTDDVIDTLLKIFTGNPAASDHVSANDLSFTEKFPFLARPHQ
ncbi:DUF4331 family protein [Candidatus Riflebacteria bacterium]